MCQFAQMQISAPEAALGPESYTVCILLYFSYKFVKGFLAITFLLLVFFNWNFKDVCQRFLYNQGQNFSLIRRKTQIIWNEQ